MPITSAEKEELKVALASLSPENSVTIAKLLYATLAASRLTKENKNGLNSEALLSLGRLIFDRHPWVKIQEVEGSINGQIRLPLIHATDTIFKTELPANLLSLTEEHRQVVQNCLDKMDDIEMLNLVKLVYQILIHTDFKFDPKGFAGVHPLSKFIFSGYDWSDLTSHPLTMSGICGPLCQAVDKFFRAALPEILIVKEEEAAQPEVPEEIQTVEEEQAPTPPQAQTVPTERLPTEGEATDLEPFGKVPDEQTKENEALLRVNNEDLPTSSEDSPASEAQAQEDHIAAAEEDEENENSESPSSSPSSDSSDDDDNDDDGDDGTPEIQVSPPPNGSSENEQLARLSRRERRKLARESQT